MGPVSVLFSIFLTEIDEDGITRAALAYLYTYYIIYKKKTERLSLSKDFLQRFLYEWSSLIVP